TTGMRVGEALGVKWSDLDLAGTCIAVQRSVQRVGGRGLVFTEPKTAKSRRLIPLAPEAAAIMEAQRALNAALRAAAQELWEEHGLLFPSERGTPQDPSHINRRFHAALAQAGLPSVRLHDLRHTFATLAFSQSASAREVQDLLGHANVQTTLSTYTHVVPQLQRQTVDRIGALLVDTDES
ncbi:MAG TPA: site-specific integrase, partial [Ktedonobacterales bacterium]|nr:site-specific integrase [Ktedonobacterales bacterium]